MSLRVGLRRLFCLLFLMVGTGARADLILTSYSASNPIKIMPVGDSITDDCSISGAWRLFLQPILETNGIAFTNTGRLLSPASAGFTQRKHEGYCGSVIGAPGVFAVYNYSVADAYLQKIVRDALAVTNNRPDLMLLLIGANDIGRGRNPWTVATNHMAALLNIIFSITPNANVILAKITTLQNASLGYAAYSTNVPIYNAALQAMVNQRRASGQRVYLADMFSTVDYTTMFLSDHLHPNALGLKAIASEWAARVETILVRPNQITTQLISGGAEWKYSASGQDPGTNWTQLDYDETSWSNGLARLGYGDPATATQVSFGPNANDKFVTTYFRRSFVVPWNAVITNLSFRLARSAGAAVWLNGQEMFRANLPSGLITYTNLALTSMTGYTSHIFYPTNIAVPGQLKGTNLIAVELHQSSVTNATLGFDMELIGSGNLIPVPALSIAQDGGNFRLSWPATNGAGFTLFASTNLTEGNWTMAAAAVYTNGAQIVVTQTPDSNAKFFRLQLP